MGGRARGADALQNFKFESVYGQVPAATDWLRAPFVSSRLGAEQGLIEDDLLGFGREAQDPTLDVVNNDGDHVVPVDVRGTGHWLRLNFGDPDTTQVPARGTLTFAAQPAAESVVTINGTAFTFKASGAAGNQVNIGANVAATVTALAGILNASVVVGVAAATYAGNGAVLSIEHDTDGLAGNTFTLAAGPGSNAKPSNETLWGGGYSHLFTSGASVLPSMCIELGHPAVPDYSVNYGVLGNTGRIAMSRRGLLNMTLGLIAKGELLSQLTSVAGTPDDFVVRRFAQATGEIRKDGVRLGGVVEANVGWTNNYEKVETIQPDSEIEGGDPGKFMGTGNLRIRHADQEMVQAAQGRDPFELDFGWTVDGYSLLFGLPRVFAPRVKRPIEGPQGIVADYQWQASGAGAAAMTTTLVNDVPSY